MRVLGIGEDCSLADMYLRLADAGHEVKVYIEQPECRDILEGMITHAPHWGDELPWIRSAGRDGLVVFETASMGALQDRLRADGYSVVGGCAFGDRLETDRRFAQRLLEDCGVPTAFSRRFRDYDAARRFLAERPGRYVLKLNDATAAATRNFVGSAADGADVRALIDQRAKRADPAAPVDFLLMEHLEGVEVGVGAYFNGTSFLPAVCLDWEHKRFFPGDLGELTGEMGTVVTYRGAGPIFERTLERVRPSLERAGYRGYINLNTIVNDRGIWPLEFTCRFGYPGYAILSALHLTGWDTILSDMAHGTDHGVATAAGFAVGVVLTVPPFPYPYGYAELSKGMPIRFAPTMTADERASLHPAEVATVDGELVTSGANGYVMVATGTGESVTAAKERAYAVARQVQIPNVRYRNDIGDKLIARDADTLRRLGWL